MIQEIILKLSLVVLLFSSLAVSASESSNCDESESVYGDAPDDVNADPVLGTNWYMNPNKTIRVAYVQNMGWRTGGEKTYWVRPQGTELLVSGHIRGNSNTVLEAEIPCCYPTGFQIVGLYFPSPGCWVVYAESGKEKLEFVTKVRSKESN